MLNMGYFLLKRFITSSNIPALVGRETRIEYNRHRRQKALLVSLHL